MLPSCRRSNRDGARQLSGADLDVSAASLFLVVQLSKKHTQ